MSGTHQSHAWVRDMFGRVAPRYDLLNHLLSFNADRYWRHRTVKRVRSAIARKDSLAVDLCCGTGDLTLALARVAGGKVLGSDFCHPMLQEAHRKAPDARFVEADALGLPFDTGSLDLVTVAFGFRNLTSYEAGLREFLRVLKPGGTAAILEFSTPPNASFRGLYDWYSRTILPKLGGFISGAPDAYTYLPDSVARFPDADRLASMMKSAGFTSVQYERMTFGIVALHTGVRPR